MNETSLTVRKEDAALIEQVVMHGDLRTCKACGTPLPATREYFNAHPSCKGGLLPRCKNCTREYGRKHYSWDNLAPACRSCNNTKSNKGLLQFIAAGGMKWTNN